MRSEDVFDETVSTGWAGEVIGRLYQITDIAGYGFPIAGWSPGSMEPEVLEERVMKGSREEMPEAWDRASPITRVNEEAPPLFAIHGDADTLVPVAEARNFVSALGEKTRAPLAYAELGGAQHAFELFPSVRTLHAVNAVHRFLAYLYSDYLRQERPGRSAA